MVFFFTGCAALLYFLNIPIRAAVTLKAGQPAILSIGIGIFNTRLVKKKYALTMDTLMKRKDRGTNRRTLTSVVLKYARRHLSTVKIFGKISLGTGDAAETAQICGLLSAVRSAISQVAPCTVHLNIEPDFSHVHFYAFARGMAEIKIGHIMGALIKGAFARKIRRVQYGTASH